MDIRQVLLDYWWLFVVVPALALLAVVAIRAYTKGVEELLTVAWSKPKGPGRLDRALWIASVWWQAWRTGAKSRAVQMAYAIGLVSLTTIHLFVKEATFAWLLSAGPIYMLFLVAVLTQPLIAGKRALERR